MVVLIGRYLKRSLPRKFAKEGSQPEACPAQPYDGIEMMGEVGSEEGPLVSNPILRSRYSVWVVNRNWRCEVSSGGWNGLNVKAAVQGVTLQ